MLRRLFSLSAAAGVVALGGALLTGQPASAVEASECGAHTGPECTTASTQACFNVIFAKWCTTISTKNYYPQATPGDLEH